MIRLVKGGIFPITINGDGKALKDLPDTGFSFPGTIQGEGKLAGIPSLFIRLSGCNLRCAWNLPSGQVSFCDTPFSSFDTSAQEAISTPEIVRIVLQNRQEMNHLVITGGEPMLQHEQLAQLLQELKQAYPFHITLETNASIFSEQVASYIDFFSLSPKLSSSIPTEEKLQGTRWARLQNMGHAHASRSLHIPVIQSFIDAGNRANGKDFQLKFVYGSLDDELEIKKLLKELKHWQAEDVLLMPLGGNDTEIQMTSLETVKACIRNGWRFAPRLHIDLFGDKHGV